jgi:glycerophosphoryl diester phosphodiesterase
VLRIDPVVRFNIELKTFPWEAGSAADGARMADAVVAAADASGAADRITVQSFDWRGPRHLRRTRPDIRLAWLTRSEILTQARAWWDGPDPSDYGGSVPRAVAAEGGPVWAPEHHDLTDDTLAEAHILGLLVVPWTVNQPEDMRRLLRWGVDGLISDRPDLARTVLAAEGFRLPQPRPAATAG